MMPELAQLNYKTSLPVFNFACIQKEDGVPCAERHKK